MPPWGRQRAYGDVWKALFRPEGKSLALHSLVMSI